MPILPSDIMPVLLPFAQLFSDRIWQWAQVLLVGAILAPVTYRHRRAACPGPQPRAPVPDLPSRPQSRHWSGLRASHILLGLLVAAFIAAGVPLVLAADETLERRTGPQYPRPRPFRDPVRSTSKRNVLSFGLRWISMMLLVRVPWSTRVWALPFLTVLAPGTQPNGRPAPPQDQYRLGRAMITWCGAGSRARPGAGGGWGVGCPQARGELPAGGRASHVGSRLRRDLRLSDPSPRPRTSRRGFAAQVPRGPAPPGTESARKRATVWEDASVTWYGGGARTVELARGQALCRVPKQAPLELRWVIVRDLEGAFEPQFFCHGREVQRQHRSLSGL